MLETTDAKIVAILCGVMFVGLYFAVRSLIKSGDIKTQSPIFFLLSDKYKWRKKDGNN